MTEPDDAADEAKAKTEAPRTRRQAVLVIHGMGEQLPLQTLRSFVETVYQRDDTLGATVVTDPDLGRVNQVWTVPDAATGTAELRKISTQPRRGDRLRTDFYEFYWADIMEGTPIEAVFGWVRGLILRSPFAVPRSVRIWIAWLALWMASVLFVLYSLATLDPSGAMASAVLGGIKGWLRSTHVWLGLALIVLSMVVVFLRFLSSTPPARVRVTLPVMLFGIGLVIALVPEATIGEDKVWTGVFAIVLGALLNSVIAPYVGDIVRYVRATPATMEKRQKVRERGLALLKNLHEKKDHGTKPPAPYYERIMVVAHSLGAIIAYDLIQLQWEAEGPTHDRPVVPAAKDPLEAIDKLVGAWWGAKPEDRKREDFPLAELQRQQTAMFEAIRAAGLNFRISDFITVGSPLAHAEFLIKDDQAALERDFEERALSSSLPRPDKPSRTASYKLSGKGPYAHFAAPFSAVRWTNIYDEHWFPLFGDIVSGPLSLSFGPGIADFGVEIMRPGWPPILNRFVTHQFYWAWHKSYAGAVPRHIRLLREALFLRGDMHERM